MLKSSHKQAEANTSYSCVSGVIAGLCFFCGTSCVAELHNPSSLDRFVFSQVQNLTLAFQAAESVGIKPSLVSRSAADLTHRFSYYRGAI